ncbi:flagellar hook-basal body complex protein [Rubellimicrobium rubrum]|uniref:Flagellar basal-body rod protein FlgF n=1 Tax=Rubellimicrobium rubrum TaxID=2585369 RepID=A0A5C4N2G0_9RHOB|nr:flagellar hook-basal body complex protein [Rubellimicrobium rubrum]TNC51564.1 flagellar hook-basal body complex protein [Rubellimicrobium rubrum]
MDNATYATLTRQTGLMAQMQMVANNIANATTTGYRGEHIGFSEYVRTTGSGASLSMATARVRETDLSQGSLSQTGGAFDLAIEGDGFFLVQTPDGPRLSRAGHFGPNENGDLVTPEGYPVLDAGGAPVFVPQGQGPVGIAPDGTISAGGNPVGQIGIVLPRDPLELVREGGTLFRADSGTDPALGGRVLQGFLEESNVNPVLEVSRMIEVQRAYEMGQGFLEREDERIRKTIQAIQTR